MLTLYDPQRVCLFISTPLNSPIIAQYLTALGHLESCSNIVILTNDSDINLMEPTKVTAMAHEFESKISSLSPRSLVKLQIQYFPYHILPILNCHQSSVC